MINNNFLKVIAKAFQIVGMGPVPVGIDATFSPANILFVNICMTKL